jgi:hypothetical protein
MLFMKKVSRLLEEIQTMRRAIFVGTTISLLVSVAGVLQGQAAPNQAQQNQERVVRRADPLPPVMPVDDRYLEWPLPANDKAYGSIDGRHLKTYVNDLTAIPERYRDQGHQFWGRITGSSADTESQQYLIGKLKAAGVSDIRVDTINLPPQWTPTSWSVVATSGSNTVTLKTAQPMLSTSATPPEGLDLEVAYVGLGSESDYIGKDVRGKAVFIYSATHNHQQSTALTERATLRAEKMGAAAIFVDMSLPGNITWELYTTGTHVPTFLTGLEDGLAIRSLVEKSPGTAPHVKIKLATEMVPNEKTATIWATLPGRSSEKIYLITHRDGFFQGASDNGSGMATMLGLAEYFGKMPKEKRGRTIVFVSTTGHHGNGDNGKPHVSVSSQWIAYHHKELFDDKTALIVNLEHTVNAETYYYLAGPKLQLSNSSQEALVWFVHGSSLLQKIFYTDLREFGVPTYLDADTVPYGEMADFFQYAPSVQVTNMGAVSHSDHETADLIPWTGLQAITRAYAKVITDLDTKTIKELESTNAAKDALSPPGHDNGIPKE